MPIAPGNRHNTGRGHKNIKARNHGEDSHFFLVWEILNGFVTVQRLIRFLTLGFTVLQP